VKRLSQTSRQGIEELRTELLSVAKLNHKNLVRLVGVCLEEREKILVYEYMPNRSLDTFIFGEYNFLNIFITNKISDEDVWCCQMLKAKL
jgi:serine/threonine protein kinase